MRPDRTLRGGDILVYRHPWPVRIAHWLNALCLVLLLGSGLQIFNAHPALYWGEVSDFDNPWLEIGAETGADGSRTGFLDVAGLRVGTTGVLGLSGEGAQQRARAFPAWATLPGYQDLGAGRRWHFFFAWVFAATLVLYLAFNLISRRLTRELLPTGAQLRDLGGSLVRHGSREYNIVQKLTYLTVILILLPGMILTGLSMSPTVNAMAPWLSDMFGGRQSARTLHFLFAAALVAFFVVHIVMVFVAGPINEMRSIITGWFRIHRHKGEAA